MPAVEKKKKQQKGTYVNSDSEFLHRYYNTVEFSYNGVKETSPFAPYFPSSRNTRV